MVRYVLPSLGLTLLLAACTGSGKGPHDSVPDSQADSHADSHTNTDDTGTPQFDPTADCDALGFPSLAFVDAEASPLLYATAADLTLHTTEGDWNLKQSWSGCDAYLFIPEEPAQNYGAPDPTWSKKKDNKALIDTMPLNTQVFFLSSQAGAENRQAALDALKVSVDDQLDTYDAETRAWKERHIHYVTDKDSRADSWLGETLTSPGWGAAIDRTQRVESSRRPAPMSMTRT